MIWMIGKARPIYFIHFWMRFQKLSYLPPVLAMCFHTQMKGFDTTEYQEAIHRSGCSPAGVVDEPKPFIQVLIIHHQSAHYHITMPTNIFGYSVHHDISTPI